MRFEWDNDKAGKNISKHGISFEEASGVFDDPLFLKFADPDHSSLIVRPISDAVPGISTEDLDAR